MDTLIKHTCSSIHKEKSYQVIIFVIGAYLDKINCQSQQRSLILGSTSGDCLHHFSHSDGYVQYIPFCSVGNFFLEQIMFMPGTFKISCCPVHSVFQCVKLTNAKEHKKNYQLKNT